MEKMNCDIIRDLIPSYVDGICSEATKKCVEEHTEGCGECRLMLASCRNNVLSGKNMEQKSLDGLKQIKKIIKIQNLALYLVLASMVILGVWMFGFRNATVVNFNYAVLFAICALVNVFAGMGNSAAPGKTEYILGGVSFVIDIYCVLLYVHLIGRVLAGAETAFGVEINQSGPFLQRQLIICFLIQIAFFLYNLISIIRSHKNCNWLLCLNMMGIFLILEYEVWMQLMESYETLASTMVFLTARIAIIGILGVAASLVCTKMLTQKPGRAATIQPR